MMKLHFANYTLQIKQPFGTAHGTRSQTEIMLVALEESGQFGFGEASLPPYYQENQNTQRAFLAKVDLEHLSQLAFNAALDYFNQLEPGNHAAKAALDIALHDLRAKQQGLSIRDLYQIPVLENIPTSYTIGIDTLDKMLAKVAAVPEFKWLKIKLNGQQDLAVIRAISKRTSQGLLVDANQAWRDPSAAIECAKALADLGVVLIEQAFPKGALAETKKLRAASPIPIFADEDVQRLTDLERLADCYDGINIKLMKCTGIREAFRMIAAARRLGLGVMLGCMTETSIGISAAAQLASFADWHDLDGHLLIDNDPCRGVACERGSLRPNALPGLGLTETHRLREILKLPQ